MQRREIQGVNIGNVAVYEEIVSDFRRLRPEIHMRYLPNLDKHLSYGTEVIEWEEDTPSSVDPLSQDRLAMGEVLDELYKYYTLRFRFASTSHKDLHMLREDAILLGVGPGLLIDTIDAARRGRERPHIS